MSSSQRPQTLSARPGARGVAATSAAAVSWVALLASTSLGINQLERLRAEVSVGGKLPAGASNEYRLIVQSYSRNSVVDGVPVAHARPLASAQRSVTPDELRHGVAVDVVNVGERTTDESVIVAWLERGSADLDFDARRARPGRGAYVGVARAERAATQIVLTREVA